MASNMSILTCIYPTHPSVFGWQCPGFESLTILSPPPSFLYVQHPQSPKTKHSPSKLANNNVPIPTNLVQWICALDLRILDAVADIFWVCFRWDRHISYKLKLRGPFHSLYLSPPVVLGQELPVSLQVLYYPGCVLSWPHIRQ